MSENAVLKKNCKWPRVTQKVQLLAINENTFQNNIEIPHHQNQKDTLKKDNGSIKWTRWVYKEHMKLGGNVAVGLEEE